MKAIAPRPPTRRSPYPIGGAYPRAPAKVVCESCLFGKPGRQLGCGPALRQMGVEHEYPVILGRDYAGVVEQVGSEAEVTRYAVGDEVFAFPSPRQPSAHDGTWAELITAIDVVELAGGKKVLIVGAAGGVGRLAARRREVSSTTPASSRSHSVNPQR